MIAALLTFSIITTPLLLIAVGILANRVLFLQKQYQDLVRQLNIYQNNHKQFEFGVLGSVRAMQKALKELIK